MEPITVENIVSSSFEDVRTFCFSLIKSHDDNITLDKELFVRRLGEYSALYTYYAELYTLLIGKVREASELHDNFKKQRLMDKRDSLEYCLKACKFAYDSLSRKVTLLVDEDDD